MRFSDLFKLKRGRDDDWFDPILSVDTLVFIDPFLLYDRESGHFDGSHNDIIAFFNAVFKLVADAKGNPGSIKYEQALDALVFPEVEEICLGYTEAGTKGSGSGGKIGGLIASAIWKAIQAGMVEIKHFEEIAIFGENIGADRISDVTAGIIRPRLVAYTNEVCERHGIACVEGQYRRGAFDLAEGRWKAVKARLPTNPYNGRPILLVPEDYLRDLPTINGGDFWDFCFSNENETLRREFGQDITRRVSKAEIVKLARRHPQFLQSYVEAVEREGGTPYNFSRDERGIVSWYPASQTYCTAHPLKLIIHNESSFLSVVKRMVKEFKHYIEENAGWELLWNDRHTPRDEKMVQRLFLGIVKHYCQANDIDVSPEPNIGRGPVDFKVSHGYELRVLLEAKLARNTKFWNGLRKQLPAYQKAEGVEHGFFLVVCFTEADFKRVKHIEAEVAAVRAATSYKITCVVIDASPEKPSASKL